MLLLAAADTHLSRLAAWVTSTFSDFKCDVLSDAAAVVATCTESGPENVAALTSVVSTAFQLPFIERVIDEALIVDDSVTFTLIDGKCAEDELRMALEACKWNVDLVHRLNVWPHVHLMAVGTAFASLGVQFHPKRFTTVVNVVCFPSKTVENSWKCHLSFHSRESVPVRPARALATASTDSKQDVLCRAHHKIDEVFSRFPTWIPGDLHDGVSVDIGAAPGGWSLYLSHKSKLVYAVDPAELSSSVTAAPNIVHLKRRVISSHDTLGGSGCNVSDLGGHFSEATPFISVLACDAVFEPEFGVQLLTEFLPKLLPGALLVFTVKFRSRSATVQELGALEVVEKLKPHFRELQVVWLFANKRERTVVGRL